MSSTHFSAKLGGTGEEVGALADDDLVDLVCVATASDGEIRVGA